MKMFKILSIISVLALLSTPVFATRINEFLKGEDENNPLAASFYAAKSFPLNQDKNKENNTAIRVKVERKTPIDNFKNAEYLVSTGIEF